MVMFKNDYLDLFNDFQLMATRTWARKVNDVIKRAKHVQIHSFIMNAICKRVFFVS